MSNYDAELAACGLLSPLASHAVAAKRQESSRTAAKLKDRSLMYYRFLKIATLTHPFAERPVHETYFVVGFWESENLFTTGRPPHWIEDFHTQPRILLEHPVSPLAEMQREIELCYARHPARSGDTTDPKFRAACHDGDPHGILSHPDVKAVRDGIAAEDRA
jgi:hypothetical protein